VFGCVACAAVVGCWLVAAGWCVGFNWGWCLAGKRLLHGVLYVTSLKRSLMWRGVMQCLLLVVLMLQSAPHILLQRCDACGKSGACQFRPVAVEDSQI
jgi:hypothetical protein